MYIETLLLGVAVGVISNTISRTKIFKSTRLFLYKNSPWIGDLVRCPYCLSHWVSFAAVLNYRLRLFESKSAVVDYFVSACVLVAIATATAGIIRWAFNGMQPSDADEYDAIQEHQQQEETVHHG